MSDNAPDKVYLSSYFARYYKSPTVNEDKKFNNNIEYILKSTADKEREEILKSMRHVFDNRNNPDYTRTMIIQAIKETLERADK